MKAAKIAQRAGVALAHTLLAEARKPIGVAYETDTGVDMGYTMCSAFYIHMTDLKNLVGMGVDLWIAVVYTLDDQGKQGLEFAVTHAKMPACELKTYPMPSIRYAAEVVKGFMAHSLLPYFEIEGLAAEVQVDFLEGKYGSVDVWGDTVTLNIKAEDFPYDVDFSSGIFKGFSDRILESMKRDVKQATGIAEDFRHRVFSLDTDICVIFVPESTYAVSKQVPKEL